MVTAPFTAAGSALKACQTWVAMAFPLEFLGGFTNTPKDGAEPPGNISRKIPTSSPLTVLLYAIEFRSTAVEKSSVVNKGPRTVALVLNPVTAIMTSPGFGPGAG